MSAWLQRPRSNYRKRQARCLCAVECSGIERTGRHHFSILRLCITQPWHLSLSAALMSTWNRLLLGDTAQTGGQWLETHTMLRRKQRWGKPVGSKINPHLRNHTLLTSATQILKLEAYRLMWPHTQEWHENPWAFHTFATVRQEEDRSPDVLLHQCGWRNGFSWNNNN